MKVPKIFYKAGRKLKNSSPTILTFFGAGGVIGTTVLAIRATPKAINIIEQKQAEKSISLGHGSESISGELTKVEIIKETWKCYIPTAIAGASTIACIFGANILNKQQQASIATLYGMVDQSYKKYRQAAKEVYGEDADEKIRAQVAKDAFVSCDGMFVYNPEDDRASDRVLFYDSFSNRYFESTVAGVLNAAYHMNRNWALRGELPINEFYTFLGLDPINGGDDIGWSYEYMTDGYMWLDFDISKTKVEDSEMFEDGLECYILDYFEPVSLLDVEDN